ncbi:hypothetical protein C6P40_002725 [Pichia californica]|uniref:Choline/ethanolaminephosphotransferase n=1 Tax=Pichia californica TaxID=460514 RepID=A0A9P6WNN4_9ASCO|nr:hypothetical protein C6P42_003883 [[Candida] californica]KAG0690480.1 hypothetical protein C6P40_002725 [[Candida] californica]
MSTFIPKDAIVHLNEYKYQSEDRSLTTKYILKPFWLKFVNIFPLSMAPNMVTLLGLMFIVISDLLVFYFDPYYDTVSPQWVYFYHSFAVFMYQTFDACDGIHARRTGQSSPLGELFDHCCDSMNTTLMVIQFSSVANLGTNTPLPFLVQFSSLANFYLSTWEEYYTHKLFLSEVSGPVEGLLLISGVFSLTGLLGVEKIWNMELFTVYINEKIGSITVTSTFISALAGGLIMAFNIYSARRNVIDELKKNKRDKEIPNALKGLYPFMIYYLTIFILFILHPTIITTYTTTMMITIGACISFTVGRIIVGHLTKQDFPYLNFPLFIPIIQAVLMKSMTSIFNVEYNDALQIVIYGGLGASISIYAMFISEIIYDITDYLDIWALTIKYPKDLKNK